MYTRKALNTLLGSIYNDLIDLDLQPERMILYGSNAKESVHEYSDVDLGLWHKSFSGESLVDIELIRPLLRKYKGLDLKMYPSYATAEDFDPFIGEIERTGKVWDNDRKELINQVYQDVL